MTYVYEQEKPWILTDDGQRCFLEIRDEAHRLLEEAGAFTLGRVLCGAGGDSFKMMACVDRLVELGEIVELTPHRKVRDWAQDRVFTHTKASER